MENERYSRQVLFSPIGKNGQQKLHNCSVLVVGAGALGTVISNHLVRSGVGKVKIVDRDYVEKSNLQRQLLYTEEDAAKAMPKAAAAEQKLAEFNRDIDVEGIIANVTIDNVHSLMKDADIVIDGTDNFSTRYLLNDACFQAGIPFSYAGVVSSRGMTGLFIPDVTPCLRCMLPSNQEAGETCDTIGVISPIVDVIASIQVTEVLKYLTDNREALTKELLTMDIWQNYTYGMKLVKTRTDCPACQTREFPALTKRVNSSETTMCGRNTVQIHRLKEIDLTIWEERLSKIAQVKRTPFLLKARIKEDIAFVLFKDGRVLIQGTDKVEEARSLYDKYIGS